MKNLLTLTLVLFLSLFIVGESRGEIPNVMLKCETLWTEPIEDRYWNSLRFTVFYDIISSSNTADLHSTLHSSDHFETRGVWWSKTPLKVSESKDLRYLYFTDSVLGEYELDRETLILDTNLSTMSQCVVLSNEKTIDDYLENHGKVMQKYIDDQRNNQLKKNKI